MTEEQIRDLAVALEASYRANGRTGYGSADLADQYMAAVPLPEFPDQRNLYGYHVRLANDQRAIDYIRCRCVLVALEVAYLRGDLYRDSGRDN